MTEFSMYEQALQAVGATARTDLGLVATIARRTYEEQPTFRFRTQVPTMEYVSLLIENALLLRTHRAGRVYTGVEKLSRLEPIIARYLRIADVSERVYVFGEADWQPPRHPNMRLLAVAPAARLAREWFIIADSPALQVALVGVAETDGSAPLPEARTYSALKTSDPMVVAHLAAAAESLIDTSLNG